jgi:conserved protein found in conjugate transposon traN
MKVSLLIILILCVGKVQSQNNIQVYVSLGKTTTIIFNNSIKHVDLGINNNIAFQTDPTIPKILKLKIANGFLQIKKTNLLVVTSDDQAYSFDINFQDTLNKYIYIIPDSLATNYKQTTINHPNNDESIMDKIKNKGDNLIRVPRSRKNKMQLTLEKICVDSTKLYFLCQISNLSNLDYNINFFNIYLSSIKTKKAISAQDIPVPILHIPEKLQKVNAHSRQYTILSIPKITLETNKIIILEIFEAKGGRHLRVKITNDLILQANRIL